MGVEYEKYRAQYRTLGNAIMERTMLRLQTIYGDCMIVFCYKDKTKTKIEQVQKCQKSAEVG